MKKNIRIKRRKYNSRKKYIFPLVVLSILLAVSMVGVFANVGDTFTVDNIKYKITGEAGNDTNKENTVSVIGPADGVELDGTLDIPASVQQTTSGSETTSYKVTTIESSAFKRSNKLSEVDLSDATNLTYIKTQAFSGCSGLTSVTLPKSLEAIGKSAFASCVNLKRVDFSNPSELSIGASAFDNCPWLTELRNLPKVKEGEESPLSITSGAFSGCCYLDGSLFPDGTDPFGATLSLDAELRGTSIDKIVPVPAYNEKPTTPDAPKRFFAGQEYQVSFDTSGRTVKGLDLQESINIPDKYTISDEFEAVTGTTDIYNFTIPESWSTDIVYLLAIATEKAKESGAPTITTDKLPDGTVGKTYSAKLEANVDNVKWSIAGKSNNDGTTGLPAGFRLDETTGTISCDEITAGKGTYNFIVTADNGISTHKKKLSLKIFDNELQSFGIDSLWWEEKSGKVSVAWTPLTASNGAVKYTIQVYDEDNKKVGNAIERTLAKTSTFESEFASEDVTHILEAAGKGTYYFTITAEHNEYGSTYASSAESRFSRGIYAYGYETYTITATATGAGTGKISLSDDSYKIKGLEAYGISNGIEVEVREDSVNESAPLTFIFTPDKGCEVTTLLVDNAFIKKNKESYTFTFIGRTDDNSSTDSSNSSGSSSGNGSTGGSTTGGSTTGGSTDGNGSADGDSGVIRPTTASSSNARVNSGNNNHKIEVEFGLVSNKIDGEIIANNTYVQGDEAGFIAIGDDMDAPGEADGDTRWMPKYWWLDDEIETETTTKHSWTSKPYTDAIDTTNLSLGTHTLYVAFQKQSYVGGTGWIDSTTVNSTDVRAADFVVTDRSGNAGDPGAADDPDGTGPDDEGTGNTTGDETTIVDDDKNDSGSSSGNKPSDGSSSGIGAAVDKITSVLKGVDTSDDMVLAVWVALALISLVGIGFCIRQIIKFS